MDRKSNRVLQNIFRCYRERITAQPTSLKDLKAIDAIVSCRTSELGSSIYECKEDQSVQVIHHSCKHRSCALCAARRRQQWIEKQQERLLDCAHFHCVFTLPSEFHVLWRFNQSWFTATFFRIVRSVLFELMKDPKHQGVVPGVLMAMHTWGRQLNLHPHIHCVVTAGGTDAQGRWKDSGDYLLPARVVRSLYRGRFLGVIREALENDELVLPSDYTKQQVGKLLRQTGQKTWCVKIEEQYAHGRGVMMYLSRYLRGGPIHPKQIVRCDNERISFRYKDHRDRRTKLLNLKPREFIRRVMLHAPETGQHMVRHYGLYASAGRAQRNACRAQVGGLMEKYTENEGETRDAMVKCAECGSETSLLARYYGGVRKGNSYKEVYASGHVQQIDEPDKTQIKKTSPPLRL